MALRHWMVKKYDEDLRASRSAQPGPFPLVLVLDHLKGGTNAARIIRTANVLGAREVHLVNMGRFDPSPARGAMRHTPLRQTASFADSFKLLQEDGYQVYALQEDGAEMLGQVEFPLRTALVAGNEEFGLSFATAAYPALRTLRIPEFGTTRSLNVAVAASVACFEWLRQHQGEWNAAQANRHSRLASP